MTIDLHSEGRGSMPQSLLYHYHPRVHTGPD